MFRSFFANKKFALWAYGVGFILILSLYAQVELSVMINEWYKDFYNILQDVKNHTVDDFWDGLIKFMYYAMPYVIIATLTSYLTSLYTLRWREAMTFEYIDHWQQAQKDVEGSSQRIQEDMYRFAKIVESLGLQIVRAVMTLIAFLPVLWNISKGLNLPIVGDTPGSLVWVALAISLGGLAISWFVGIKLPGLEYNNQKVEAAFRKELVYAEDDKVNYGQSSVLFDLFTGLKINYHRLFLHYGYFNIWLYSFSQAMVVVPYIFMGPSLFTGAIKLGVMIQVSNAFSQVRGSFSVFTSHWTTITELRSIYKRLKEFEKNIDFKRK